MIVEDFTILRIRECGAEILASDTSTSEDNSIGYSYSDSEVDVGKMLAPYIQPLKPCGKKGKKNNSGFEEYVSPYSQKCSSSQNNSSCRVNTAANIRKKIFGVSQEHKRV